jgi:3',5'-cyclic AMP phosphodiesterase CpdA
MTMPADPPRLLAISDLHVSYDENRAALDGVQPQSPGDWLLVVGDVAEKVADIEWALRALARRFAVVAWVPGNHDLWTHPRDPVQLRGEERYRHLVDLCRSAGVLTPEDPYPVFEGGAGPVTIAPLFLLYDYTFRPAGAATREEGLAMAYQAGIVATDEIPASRSVPQPRGVVPGPGAGQRGAAGPAGGRPAHRPGQSLAADP